jgi:putative DNA primase/helicase
MNARSLARALGGDAINAHQVVCPGPGHSPRDRSMSVFIDWQAPDGFRVHPHAPGDDWRECRDYVKQRLGILSKVWTKPHDRRPAESVRTVDTLDADRTALALAIWQEARS